MPLAGRAHLHAVRRAACRIWPAFRPQLGPGRRVAHTPPTIVAASRFQAGRESGYAPKMDGRLPDIVATRQAIHQELCGALTADGVAPLGAIIGGDNQCSGAASVNKARCAYAGPGESPTDSTAALARSGPRTCA